MTAQPVAVILAGGRSTRFGRDKAAVVWRGQRLIDRLASVAAPHAAAVVVVGGTVELPPGVKRLPDLESGGGPVQAVLAALRHYPDRPLLTLACDQPLVDAALLTVLAAPLPAGFSARVPRLGGHAQPLAALYGPASRPAFETVWAGCRRSMMAVLEGLVVEWLDDAALAAAGVGPQALADCDTPEELEELAREPGPDG